MTETELLFNEKYSSIAMSVLFDEIFCIDCYGYNPFVFFCWGGRLGSNRMTTTTIAKCKIDFTVASDKLHSVYFSVHHANSCIERMILFNQ